MLEIICQIYLLGCLSTLIPLCFIIIAVKQKKEKVPFTWVLTDILLSWYFTIAFIIGLLILRKKAVQKPNNPSTIPKTEDCAGFLNFSIKVRVENKNRFGGVVTVLDQPLVMILNQYMKDYGFHPEKYDENDLRVVLKLPTGSEAFFPFATKDAPKNV